MRRLQPGVGRDLETICLKCLEKEPGRRYQRAAELAADLQRYIEHRPVMARRPSTWRRASLWTRRRPALALLVAITALVSFLLPAGLLWHSITLQRAFDVTDQQRRRAEESQAAAEASAQAAQDGEAACASTSIWPTCAWPQRLRQGRGPGGGGPTCGSVSSELAQRARQ